MEEGKGRLKEQEVCCKMVSPRNVREARSMKSNQHGCLTVTWTRTTSADMLMCKGESPQGLSPKQRNTGNCGILRAGETIFLRKEHNNWLSHTKWSALKTYTHPSMYVVYIYTIDWKGCIHTSRNYICNNKEKGHEFETERMWVLYHERVGEGKGEMI